MGQHDIDPVSRPYDPSRMVPKPTVDPSTLFALDLRVGVVTDVASLEGARKPAWLVTVDFGELVGRLTTSAQVTNYAAAELLGRTVIGVVNLPPKRIAGFRSEFLLLAGLAADGTCHLLGIDGELPIGSVVA